MKYEIKDISPNKKKIEAEITAEEFDNFYNQALKNLNKEAELPGFRKGKAPEKMVEEKIGSEAILSEAAENAIRDTWLKILKSEKMDTISQPEVEITKIAKSNPFIFTLEVEVLPKIELPNIKEIAAQVCVKQETIAVSEKEVEDTVQWLQQSRSKIAVKNGAVENGDLAEINFEFLSESENLPKGLQQDSFIVGKNHYLKGIDEALLGMKKGEDKNFQAKIVLGADQKEENVEVKLLVKEVKKVELPEITDEWANQIGNFDSLKSLKDDIKKGIIKEKEIAAQEKKRGEVLEKISEKVKVEIPTSLRSREENALFENFKNRVNSEIGIPLPQYLEQIKKTEQEIKNEFKKVAEQRVKLFLIFNQIEKDEKIEVLPEEINEKIEQIVKQYPDPEKVKKEIEKNESKIYLIDEIKREKIFKLLGC
ncbi:MAG: trigger factor [Candidatus Paceibacterota bacterium]